MLSIDWFGSAPVCRTPGGEEVGVTQKRFIQEGSPPPPGLTPYPFICHFWQKRYPFHIPSIEKWPTPFTYLVDNFASHSTAVNALSLKCESIRQNQNISSTSFTTIKCIVSPFGPFYRPNKPFHILQLVKSLTFFYLKPKNSTPFRRSQSLIGHYWEYTPCPPPLT